MAETLLKETEREEVAKAQAVFFSQLGFWPVRPLGLNQREGGAVPLHYNDIHSPIHPGAV